MGTGRAGRGDLPCPKYFGLMAALSSLRQTHGSRLRLHHVSPADSGEYVCRVVGGSGPEQEASFTVTVPPSAGSSYRECGRCHGQGRERDPGAEAAGSSQPSPRAQPSTCLIPQALGAPSSLLSRPAAPCSRVKTPASSASSMTGQPPSAWSGRLGTKNWKVSWAGWVGWRQVGMPGDRSELANPVPLKHRV